MGIENLDARIRSDVDQVVALRRQCFPEEEPVELRYHLWGHYLFADLVEDGLMRCTVARRDGKIVGFVAYTKHPNDFPGAARRRHPVRLGGIVLRGLLTQPGVVRNVKWLLNGGERRRRVLRPTQLPADTGEILMVAVEPGAQGWVPEGGNSRVSMRLIDAALQYFEQEKMREVFLLVHASNTASNMLCHSLGCRMEKAERGDLKFHHFYYSLAGTAS